MIKTDEVFARHIVDSIDAIYAFIKDCSVDEFEKDRLRQSAVIRELEVIGEAVKNISDKSKKLYKEIPWKQIAGMRDKLIHHYFGVDVDTIWQTIEKDIPILKKTVEKILKME